MLLTNTSLAKVAKTKITLVAVLLIAPAISLKAQHIASRITHTGKNGATVSVTEITPNILRIENSTAPIAQDNDFSTSSTLNRELIDVTPRVVKGTSLSTSSGISAIIDPKTGSVNISAPCMSISDPGLRPVENGITQLKLYTGHSGSFYGAGERGHRFNLAGDTLVMYNRQNYGYVDNDPRIAQMNVTMPLLVSAEGYAIVFDDFAPASLVPGDPIVYTTESAKPVSYYVVYGNGSLPRTVENLSLLTGRQDLPPLWALGYITSKYGYRDQNETLAVVDTLKRGGYPVDGIVLDLYWYGKEEDMGRFEWDPEQWPDAAAMLDSLKRQKVNLVAISQPYILQNGRGVDNYNLLSDKKMLALDSVGDTHPVTIWVGEGGMLDVSNPETVNWLTERYKSLTDMGVAGWWGDLGEPEVHPETAYHHNGLTARQYHNRYGNDWSKIIYDLFAAEYPDRRLMTLMRGGTTGLQRYSVFPWSTDVSRSWGGLQPQVKIMLSSGLSGLGYMSHDVGGFAIDPEKPVDPELYVRWLQLGLFSPILRTHAQQVAEPYHYTEHQDIILPLIKERYRWLPYNYTLAYENALMGLPFVRPLEFYSGSAAADDITDEYLWGRDVLVAPVLTQGTTARDIKLPEGKDRWIDITNRQNVYAGGSTVKDYPAPLAKLPLFVREGAFIPSAQYDMENTADYRPDRYRVDYYPLDGSDSEFTLYEDDFTSPNAAKKGEYLSITFAGRDKNGHIEVVITSHGQYPGMAEQKEIELVVHGVANTTPKVLVNGRSLNAVYNPEAGTLTIPLTLRLHNMTVVNITE